jgi:hypothetical protein
VPLPPVSEQRRIVDVLSVYSVYDNLIENNCRRMALLNENGESPLFQQGATDFGDRFVTHAIYSIALTRLAEAGDTCMALAAAGHAGGEALPARQPPFLNIDQHLPLQFLVKNGFEGEPIRCVLRLPVEGPCAVDQHVTAAISYIGLIDIRQIRR